MLAKNEHDEWYIAVIVDQEGNTTLPKGHLESCEIAVEAATREVTEELGLLDVPDAHAFLQTVTYAFLRKRDERRHEKRVDVFLFSLPSCVRLTPPAHEGIQMAQWMTIEAALTSLAFHHDVLRRARGMI